MATYNKIVWGVVGGVSERGAAIYVDGGTDKVALPAALSPALPKRGRRVVFAKMCDRHGTHVVANGEWYGAEADVTAQIARLSAQRKQRCAGVRVGVCTSVVYSGEAALIALGDFGEPVLVREEWFLDGVLVKIGQRLELYAAQVNGGWQVDRARAPRVVADDDPRAPKLEGWPVRLGALKVRKPAAVSAPQRNAFPQQQTLPPAAAAVGGGGGGGGGLGGGCSVMTAAWGAGVARPAASSASSAAEESRRCAASASSVHGPATPPPPPRAAAALSAPPALLRTGAEAQHAAQEEALYAEYCTDTASGRLGSATGAPPVMEATLVDLCRVLNAREALPGLREGEIGDLATLELCACEDLGELSIPIAQARKLVLAAQILLAKPLPSSFQCPISLQLIVEPVVLADGHTYDRRGVESWLARRRTSPLTNAPLASANVLPNHSIKSQIVDYLTTPPTPNAHTPPVMIEHAAILHTATTPAPQPTPATTAPPPGFAAQHRAVAVEPRARAQDLGDHQDQEDAARADVVHARSAAARAAVEDEEGDEDEEDLAVSRTPSPAACAGAALEEPRGVAVAGQRRSADQSATPSGEEPLSAAAVAAAQLQTLVSLRDSHALTDAEFAQLSARVVRGLCRG